jgi:hypothetical protein
MYVFGLSPSRGRKTKASKATRSAVGHDNEKNKQVAQKWKEADREAEKGPRSIILRS